MWGFMRNLLFLFIFIASSACYAEVKAGDVCKNLKSCAEWAQKSTGVTYILSKNERKSLKIEKDFDLSEGAADIIFSYILFENDLTKLKRENGSYEIVSVRDVKNFTFPILKIEEVTANFDFYAIEFSFDSKIKLKNAAIIARKLISKNARVVESADGTKLFVTDTGGQLHFIKSILSQI
jgi:type II secretory pathway component GspD/PulD (secretin)